LNLSPNALAATGFRAFCAALGTDMNWLRLNEAQQQAWLILANKFDGLTDNLEGRTAQQATEFIYGFWCKGGGLAAMEWAEMPIGQRVAWEAACRHMWMCLETERKLDLVVEEQNWKAWAARKIAKLEEGSRNVVSSVSANLPSRGTRPKKFKPEKEITNKDQQVVKVFDRDIWAEAPAPQFSPSPEDDE